MTETVTLTIVSSPDELSRLHSGCQYKVAMTLISPSQPDNGHRSTPGDERPIEAYIWNNGLIILNGNHRFYTASSVGQQYVSVKIVDDPSY